MSDPGATGRRDVTFSSGGVRCAGWHFVAAADPERLGDPQPCLVMAHGFGGTRDTGLVAYAEGFAAAGLHVLLFDYRGFGESAGQPRQHVSYRGQRADYRAAIAAARALPGVDPSRIVLWGTSYSGGHVVPVAVGDGAIAAVIALTPAMDGLAALGALVRRHPASLVPLVAHALRDRAGALIGRRPRHLPIVGEPGSTAMITAPGALTGYQSLAGPTWRNEVCARVVLEVAFNRPTRYAARLNSPLLVQIGELDAVAPPQAALTAARKAGPAAEVRTYPVGHFDVYTGDRQRELLAEQLRFLHQCLAPSASIERLVP